ncbi:hypothetical protein HN014_22225 (plasmid) [Aquimarina sp. TRL1]|uniref:hypothetical protein n=1 Tax=Aquimarina sp. (strain TRL1) TaxID=2736252 RepID=UPI00158BE7C6|nr:hypothetical protein [Aquimarina sp. TRL1]QKX07719.1 hypothetical protein HN014_22225 [Aquimarina sp. TRL1]
MTQEIFYKAKITFDKKFDIDQIKKDLNELFIAMKICKVTDTSIVLEITTEYNTYYDAIKIKRWIFGELLRAINFEVLTVLVFKEEAEIYDLK